VGPSFLDLFVRGVLLAPAAVFFERDFALNFLFIFAAPVINALAIAAGQFD